mgnify:CR=1 FL=1
MVNIFLITPQSTYSVSSVLSHYLWSYFIYHVGIIHIILCTWKYHENPFTLNDFLRHCSIFKSNCKNFKNKNIILDQATSFWKPEIANNYFDNLKVVIVTRDPRSVFYSMKFRGSYAYPGYNLEKFVRWYDEIFKKQKILQKQKPQKTTK